MHTEILSQAQTELLPHIAKFKRSFYLVGGTAIALHIGHRRSIDFDLFTFSQTLRKQYLKDKIYQIPFSKRFIAEDIEQIHFLINGVKTTFFAYPFDVPHKEKFENIITLPSLLQLAAMKAYALGRRAKWKDYLDLYFILKDHFSLDEISAEAEKIFGDMFSEKMFRQQLAFHKDIDYSEEVEFLPNYFVDKQKVKDFLIEKSLKNR